MNLELDMTTEERREFYQAWAAWAQRVLDALDELMQAVITWVKEVWEVVRITLVPVICMIAQWWLLRCQRLRVYVQLRRWHFPPSLACLIARHWPGWRLRCAS